MNRTRLPLLLATVLTAFAGYAPASDAQTFDPLEWFENRQALMIHVDSGADFWENMQSSKILEHPQLVELMNFLETAAFAQLLVQNGFTSTDPENPAIENSIDTFESILDHLLSKRIYLFVQESTTYRIGQWTIALETDLTSAQKCQAWISRRFGWAGKTSSGNSVRDDGMQSLFGGRLHWFYQSGFLFVSTHQSEAQQLQSRIRSGQKPKRAFIDGRKYLRATGKSGQSSHRFRDGSVTIYFDPSIAANAFESLPKKFWDEFGLSNVTGSVLQIGFPDSADDQMPMMVDGQLSHLEPVPPLHLQFINAPPIDTLPPLPPHWYDVQLGSVALKTAMPSIESAFDSVYGGGSFSKALSSSLAGEADFDWQASRNAFGNVFGQASYLYRYSMNETPKPRYYKGVMKLIEVSDQAAAMELTGDLVQSMNDKAHRTVMSRAEDLPDPSWFLAGPELASRQDQIVALLRKQRQPVPAKEELFVENRGYVLLDTWLLQIQRNAYEHSLMTVQQDQELERMIKSVAGEESDVIALWATRPYKWKSWLATAIWQVERKLRTKGSSFSMKGFNRQLRPLNQVKSIQELNQQASLRLVGALIENLGTSLFTISPAGNNYRIRGGLFLPSQPK